MTWWPSYLVTEPTFAFSSNSQFLPRAHPRVNPRECTRIQCCAERQMLRGSEHVSMGSWGSMERVLALEGYP